MKKITIKAILTLLLLFGVFISLGILKANAASLSNSEKAYYLGAQIAIAFENEYRGLKPSSAINSTLHDTTYYYYNGDELSSSNSTKFGTTYYYYIYGLTGKELTSVENANGYYDCNYIGIDDKISSCDNNFPLGSSLGTIEFSFFGNKLHSSSNYTSGVNTSFSYLGNNLNSTYSYGLGTTDVFGADQVPSSVATPTASLAGGVYSSSQMVTLSTTTSGAKIYYTTDGSTPTSNSNEYWVPLSVLNTVLKAIAIKSTGINDSDVMVETYTTPNYTFPNSIQVTSDTPTLAYSSSKKAKKRINFTFSNLSLTKKKYIIMKIGGKKVKVIRVRRSGSNSIVNVELKYSKWHIGNYRLVMSYKYKNHKKWARSSVSKDDVLSIY